MTTDKENIAIVESKLPKYVVVFESFTELHFL